MSSDTSVELERENRLNEIIVEYFETIEQGTASEPAQFVAEYPEYATELEEFFDDRKHFTQVVQPLTQMASTARGCGGLDGTDRRTTHPEREEHGESAVASRESGQSAMGTASAASDPNAVSPVEEEEGVRTVSFQPGEGVQVRTVGLPEPLAVPGEFLGDGNRYRYGRELGRGGLGRVMRAEDLQLGREIAIKECLPRAQASKTAIPRFFQEARITGQLEHPGIVPVYELGMRSDHRCYYAMKLLRGRSLASEIRAFRALADNDASRPLRRNKLLRIFVEICNAIAYAHSKRVLHRDLKPQNVMLGDFGEATVVDWGLAKVMSESNVARDSALSGRRSGTEEVSDPGAKQRLSGTEEDSGSQVQQLPASDTDKATSIGTVLGTPAYMSPEQAFGRIDVMDERSDIFSLGVILYEILVGCRPFEGDTQYETIANVRRGVFTKPRRLRRDVPRPLDAVCTKALAFRPEARYPTATALAEDVNRWLAGEPVEAYAEPWYQRTWRWLRRHPKLVSYAAATLMAVAAFITYGRWEEARHREEARRQAAGLLREAQQLYFGGASAKAQDRLIAAAVTVKEVSGLNELKADIQRLNEQVAGVLNEQKACAEAAEKLSAFRTLRDQVLFHGTFFTGTDVPAALATAKASTREALGLFAIDVERPSLPELDERYFSNEQRQEISSGCRELLLMYASMVGYAPAGAPEEVRRDRAEQALRTLEQAQLLGTCSKADYLRRAQWLQELGRSQEAQTATTLAAKTPASTAGDYFLVGQTHYFDRGDFKQAISFFTEALRQQPDHFWSQYFLATSFLQLDRPREALAHLAAAQSHKHRFVWIHTLRGYAHGRLKEFDIAEDEFRLALAADPGPHEKYAIYNNRGAMRVNGEQLEEAIVDLRQAIDLEPQGYQAHLNLGEALRQQGKLDEALAQLQRAVELSPGVAKCYRVRASLFLDRQELEAALADFDQALRLQPHSSMLRAEIHYERARVLDRLGRIAEAVSAYQAALELQPNMRKARWLQAQALMALGRYDKAMPVLNEYLEPIDADDVDIEAYRQRGHEYSKQGRHGEAIADYTRALRQAPRSPQTRQERGWALLNNAHQLALEDFDAAIQAQPKNGDLYNGRGYARVMLGQIDQAVADAETAVRLGPANPDDERERFSVHYNAGCVYARAWSALVVGVTGRKTDPRTGSIQEYRDRAVKQIVRAVESLPQALRAAYVQQTVLSDPALEALRGSGALGSLISQYPLK